MPDTLLTFVQITDTHINPDPDYGLKTSPHNTREGAEALVQQVNALPFKVDFVLHTGDIIYDPEPEPYYAAREILGQIKYPVYYVAGNHDHPAELQRILLGRSEILSPFHYEFEVNGVQIIVLDSNGPAEPPRGYITPEQLTWLHKLCARADTRPLVVAVHHNVVPIGSPWLDDYMRITNGEDLHRVLLSAKDRLRGIFFGHVHQGVSMYRDGLLYTSGLSSWSQFKAWPGLTDTTHDVGAECGFNVVTITHNQTFIRHWRFRVK